MSETTANEQPDLSSLPDSPGGKRKREEDSPDSEPSKRMAPAANMSVAADTAAFIENAIEAGHAANANGVNVADFNALQQATADPSVATDTADATSTAQAALGIFPTLHVPPSTEEQFAAHGGLGSLDFSVGNSLKEAPQGDASESPQVGASSPPQSTNGTLVPHSRFFVPTAPSNKPQVGTEEWHKMRKDNHKEVERRRRETINEGINELAKMVPGCERNKGSILSRAVNFITQLKENEAQNIEKWTLEKLLTEQAITELSASNDKLKQECERLYRELETWKTVAQNAGLEPPKPKEEPGAATTST